MKTENIKDIERYLNLFTETNNQEIRESMATTLDNSFATIWPISRLAEKLDADPKTAKQLEDIHDEFAHEFGLPLLELAKMQLNMKTISVLQLHEVKHAIKLVRSQIGVWKTMLNQEYNMYITRTRLRHNLNRDMVILHQLYTQEQMIEQP